MTFALTTPVTGTAQTGFTAPTYTITADKAPDVNAVQWAVTALGGTQTGVSVHSVSSPFTITQWKPKSFQALGKPNPTTGLIGNVPYNTYTTIVRKGMLPLAGQPFRNAILTLKVEIPAGSDTADAEDIRAAMSLMIGSLNQQSAGLGDMLVSGIL